MIVLKCDCCGFEQQFVDAEDAFNAGWDAPPHFTGFVCCNLCPAAYQFRPGGWSNHAEIHAQWEIEGRPENFTQEMCVPEKDRVPEAALDVIRQFLGPKKA